MKTSKLSTLQFPSFSSVLLWLVLWLHRDYISGFQLIGCYSPRLSYCSFVHIHQWISSVPLFNPCPGICNVPWASNTQCSRYEQSKVFQLSKSWSCRVYLLHSKESRGVYSSLVNESLQSYFKFSVSISLMLSLSEKICSLWMQTTNFLSLSIVAR